VRLINKIKKLILGVIYDVDLPPKVVNEIISRNNAEKWFYYIFKDRKKRWDTWMPAAWIYRNCNKDSVIFEPGCGCGLNLIWLGQQGFLKLNGSDIKPEAINAASELTSLAKLEIELWVDDALKPQKLPTNVDVIIALNWTSLLDQFDFNEFLSVYSKIMHKSGYIIIDVIDSTYNDVLNNQYLTSDWTKPVRERCSSEYKKRYSFDQVANMATIANFEIYDTIKQEQTIPKVIYILRKN